MTRQQAVRDRAISLGNGLEGPDDLSGPFRGRPGKGPGTGAEVGFLDQAAASSSLILQSMQYRACGKASRRSKPTSAPQV